MRKIIETYGTAIAGATLLALLWPSLPWSDAKRIVIGPTKVGVIDRQIDNGGSGRVGERAPAKVSSLVSASGAVDGTGREASNACNPAFPVTNGLFSGTKKYLPGPDDPGELLSRPLECMKLNMP